VIWWLKKQFLRLKLYAAENYQQEAESLIIWYAVCYALGVAFYFTLPWELPVWIIVIYLEAVLLLLYLTHRKVGQFKVITYVTIFILGLCVAKADALYRNHKLEKDMPEISYLSGRVKDISLNASGRQRVLLDDVNDYEHDLKGDFRISFLQKKTEIKHGDCIELIAKLPKSYTYNPLGNYDFARRDFYQGISASGYVISPIFKKDCEQPHTTITDKINQWRDDIKQIVEVNTRPEQSAIIKALTIGDKSGIEKTQAASYRTAGLAHLLAISGMHMGMIVLLTFLLIRLLLLPFGSGRYDWRKPAAVISIIMALIYFLISGQSVSCIRAFIMTMCVMVAVLLNRRPISQRLWALAILIVVTITPVAVVTPGFLMSFAAVLGIVSFYEANAESLKKWYIKRSILGRIGIYLLGVIITDLVASLMTLPYTIYYFHQISVYTTLGNLLAGPVIVFLVMPALLLFLVTSPFSISTYTVKPVATGVDIINQIASWVASLAGAKSGEGIGMMTDWGLFIITIGILWLCIWQAKWRYWGIVMILLGFSSLLIIPKADFVFDKDGSTFACRTADNKLSVTPWHKNKFLITVWTGSSPTDTKEYTKAGLSCDKKQCQCGKNIRFTKGKVWYKEKIVNLQNSGYINQEKGIIYNHQLAKRLWND